MGCTISNEEQPRRDLSFKIFVECLNDGCDPLLALPYDEHAHIVDSVAGSMYALSECRIVCDELSQDRGLLDPPSYDRHGAAVDLEEEELAILGRRELRVRNRENAVGLEVKRAAGSAVVDVDAPAGRPAIGTRRRRRLLKNLMLGHQPKKL